MPPRQTPDPRPAPSARLGAQPVRISRAEPGYPAALRAFLGEDAPPSLVALGDLALLRRTRLALFCSVRCPGSLILRTYDLAQRLRQSDLAVVGGFQSPMERECLKVLLRGPQPVILCPTRDVEGMRLPAEFAQPLREGRLLILSCFPGADRRVTVEIALARNRFVAALADAVFVAHAAPGGKTEAFCRYLVSRRKPLFSLEGEANRDLIALGAQPLRLEDVQPGWSPCPEV